MEADRTQSQAVELPVCPICGLVGRQPGHNSKTKYFCAGANPQHKRVTMKLVRYVPEKEVVS